MNTQFESPRAVRTQIKFEVKINNSDMMGRVADWEVREMERVTNYASNIELPTVEDVLKYLKMLTYLRVQKVNGERIEPDFKHIFKDLYVPARWYTLLDNIGEAHDWSTNIKFVPAYEIDAAAVMSFDELVRMSDQLQALKPDGYACEKGIPTHTDGSVEMMAKVALAEGKALETIRGMDIHNPVFAFFASLFQMEVVGLTYADLDRMYRIEYSAPSKYKASFRDYWKSVDSFGQDSSSDGNSSDGKGPKQPKPGTPPPNLGHEGQGAVNSNGNLKD